jgi:hypothetical protein
MRLTKRGWLVLVYIPLALVWLGIIYLEVDGALR